MLYVGQGSPNRLAHLAEGVHSCRYALAHAVAHLPPETAFEVRIVPGGGYSALLETAALTEITLAVGEMPPANRRWESWLCYRVPTLLARWAHSETWHPRAADEPSEDARACWVHRYDGSGRWEYSLGCLYPTNWANPSRGDAGLVLIEPSESWDPDLRALLEGGRPDWVEHHRGWKPARLRAWLPVLGLAGDGDGSSAGAWVERLIKVLGRHKEDDLEGAAWIEVVLSELGATFTAKRQMQE